MIIFSSPIGILFGGIHLIGWNYQFVTDIERHMWRISSIVVTVEPAILAAGFILGWLEDEYPRLENLVTVVGGGIAILAVYVGPILYVPRIALLVLPLFALRNLPPTAHQNVQWSDYIPHI
ncbi:hypothetical protein AX16_008431 [Volvariella volvacea WC 439]|nr:hypothetical protein AX16_008431 [Volvariella volvacea WC 439]